jgi:DNA-binding IclR family transcriptional regulator
MPKTTRTTEQENVAEPRAASKSAAIIALLSRPNGATLAELTDATAWQKHTARAALTSLKKKGHTIERTKADGVSRYRIASAAAQ